MAAILAIDLGSTTFKAGIYDEKRRLLGEGSGLLDYYRAADGRVELSISFAENALREAVAGALTSAAVKSTDITAVGMSSQAQTFTRVDAQGKALHPFISWQDTSALPLLNQEPDCGLRTFSTHGPLPELLAEMQLCKLIQQFRNGMRPGQGETIQPLPGYLVRLMTGRLVTDRNLAGMSGLYSLSEQDWWTPALQACGLRTEHLPELIDFGASAGITCAAAEKFGIPVGVPVVLAGNDQTAGACAVGLPDTGGTLLTLGTALVVYHCTDRLMENREGVIRGSISGETYFQLTTDSCGGSLMIWAVKHIDGCDSPVDLDRLAMGVDDADGLVFVGDEHTATGRWEGIRPTHTASHFARALFDYLAERTVRLIHQLVADPVGEVIKAAGGGTRSEPWMTLIEEKLGQKLVREKASPIAGIAWVVLAQKQQD